MSGAVKEIISHNSARHEPGAPKLHNEVVTLASIHEDLRKLLPDPDNVPRGFTDAQTEIRVRVQTHLKSLELSEPERSRLLSPQAHTIDLLDKIPKLPANDRKVLLTELVDLACGTGVVAKCVRLKMRYAFRDIDAEERRFQVRRLLSKPEPKQADANTVCEILRSCSDIQDLQSTLSKASKSRVMKVNNSQLREIVAIAVVYKEMQLSDRQVKEFKKEGRGLRQLKAIISGRTGLTEKLELLANNYPRFKTTRVYRDYSRILSEAMKEASRPKYPAAFLLEKLQTALTERAVFIEGRDQKSNRSLAWNPARFEQAKAAFSVESDSEPLFRARVREYRLVGAIFGKEVLAHRGNLNRIKIRPQAFHDAAESEMYAGVRSGTVFMIHENSHDVFQGSDPGPGRVRNREYILKQMFGEAHWDIHEFAAINRWVSYSGREVGKSRNGAYAEVILEGGRRHQVTLERKDPVLERTFVRNFDENVYFSYGSANSRIEVAADLDALRDPAEDFVIKRTAYLSGLVISKSKQDAYLYQFIEKCPQAFLYFERRDRAYHSQPKYREYAHEIIAANEEADRRKLTVSVPAQRTYENPTLDQERINDVYDFLKSRFVRMTAAVQKTLLANLRMEVLEVDGYLNTPLMEISTEWRKPGREAQFEQLISKTDESTGQRLLPVDKLVSLFKQAYQDHLPALFFLERAIRNGDAVGLVTGHLTRLSVQRVVGEVHDFLNYGIGGDLTYCISDPERNRRLKETTTDGRIAEIVVDRVRGYRIGQDDQRKDFRRQFNRVILLDDDDQNIATVKSFAENHGFSDRVVVIDAKQMSAAQEIDLSLNQIAENKVGNKQGLPDLILADINHTLCVIQAKARVITSQGPNPGRSLIEFTKQDIDEYPRAGFGSSEEFMLTLTRQSYPALDSEQFRIEWDSAGEKNSAISLSKSKNGTSSGS
jgi:hypothetical protein